MSFLALLMSKYKFLKSAKNLSTSRVSFSSIHSDTDLEGGWEGGEGGKGRKERDGGKGREEREGGGRKGKEGRGERRKGRGRGEAGEKEGGERAREVRIFITCKAFLNQVYKCSLIAQINIIISSGVCGLPSLAIGQPAG